MGTVICTQTFKGPVAWVASTLEGPLALAEYTPPMVTYVLTWLQGKQLALEVLRAKRATLDRGDGATSFRSHMCTSWIIFRTLTAHTLCLHHHRNFLCQERKQHLRLPGSAFIVCPQGTHSQHNKQTTHVPTCTCADVLASIVNFLGK